MSFTEKRLCNPTQLNISGQTLYTVPASKTSIIKQIVVTNVTGSAVTFSLYIGSAATPNALFSATSVAANDTIIVNLSQVLNSLDILTALASANNSLNITISGVENDGPLNPLSVYIADQAITTNRIADGSVTSAKIADETIVNTDINASAAIAQSKVANLVSDLALKAPLLSPSFVTPSLGNASATTIDATGTVKGSGSIVQFVSNSQGSSDLSSQGTIGTVTITPKYSNSTMLVWINYHAYKYNSNSAVNNIYSLRNATSGVAIRGNEYLVYSSPEYMFQGVVSGTQSAGSTTSRQYSFLVNADGASRIYFYWTTMYAMEIAA